LKNFLENIFSGILPRQDDAHHRGVEVNRLLSDYCESENSSDRLLLFVDFSQNFTKQICFRFAETRQSENPDPVHLSEHGIRLKKRIWALTLWCPSLLGELFRAFSSKNAGLMFFFGEKFDFLTKNLICDEK